AKIPAERYASALELAQELVPLDDQTDVRESRRVKFGWAALAVLAIFALLIGWSTRSWFATADPAMVAVLPFEDLSDVPTERYISQGVTEEVIAQLGRAGSSGFGV